MTSTIITHDELLKRGWESKGRTGVNENSPIKWIHPEFADDGVFIEIYRTGDVLMGVYDYPNGRMGFETIEELHSHLRHFGLIEPEPITAEGLLAMGFEKEPAHDKDAGISTYRLKNVKVLINIAGDEFLFAYYKEFMTLVDTMQDLRDLCRLMGINNTPPNGGEGGTNA